MKKEYQRTNKGRKFLETINLEYAIQSFDDNYDLSEIILIGKNKGVRRIILE
jgi:hypothetical protein